MNNVIQRVRRAAGDMIVHLTGEIDLNHSPSFHESLVDLSHENPKRLIVDLSQVAYIDSSGVGALVEVFRRLKRNGSTMVLVAPSERVSSVLEITKLDQFFTIAATEQEALEL